MDALYDIDCELNYQTHTPSTCIFKIEAALRPEQRVLAESLTVSPDVRVTRHTDTQGYRPLRLSAQAGPLSVRYQASVADLRQRANDPDEPAGVRPRPAGQDRGVAIWQGKATASPCTHASRQTHGWFATLTDP